MTEQNENKVYPRGCTPCVQHIDDSPFFDGGKPMSDAEFSITLFKGLQPGKSITSGMLPDKMLLDERIKLGLITPEQYNEMIQAVATAYEVDINESQPKPPSS